MPRIVVRKVITHPAADGSSQAYQQTSAGDGGFNSVFIDDTYSYRHLGKNIALGLDWLDGYVGFASALKTEAISLLGALLRKAATRHVWAARQSVAHIRRSAKSIAMAQKSS